MVIHQKNIKYKALLDFYFENIFLNHLVELLAALAGTYYLIKKEVVIKIEKYFIYFLWATLFIDIAGLYAIYAYFTQYENLEFLRESPFRRNEWLFNSFNILFFVVYMFYFIEQLNSSKTRRLLFFLSGLYLITEILNLIFSGVYFVNISTYGSIVGTIVLILCIMAYYYEMLKSNSILNFYRELAFYVSIGVLIRYLIVTPLFIYSNYLNVTSPDFVEIHSLVMVLANIFMYGMFVVGFLICSGRRNNEIPFSFYEKQGVKDQKL